MDPLDRVGHLNYVLTVAFSNDGKVLGSGSRDGTVKLWDIAGRSLKETLRLDGSPVDLLFLPQDLGLAISTRQVFLWHPDKDAAECFPDPSCRKLLVSSSGGVVSVHHGGGITIWNPWGWKRTSFFNPGFNGGDSVALTPSGGGIALSSKERLVVLDLPEGKVRWEVPSGAKITSLDFSPDEALLACADSCDPPHVRDARTGEQVMVLGGPRDPSLRWRRQQLIRFSRDGLTIAIGGNDGVVSLWDIRTSRRKDLVAPEVFTKWPDTGSRGPRPASHSGWVRTICFSPDGRSLASAGDDYVVRLWDLASGELEGSLGQARNEVVGVAISRDKSRVLSGHADGFLRLWDDEGRQLGTARAAEPGALKAFALSPREDRVFTGNDGGTVKFLDYPGFKLEGCLEDRSALKCLLVSPDGSWLSWGGSRMEGEKRVGNVRLWNLEADAPGPALSEWGEVKGQTPRGWWEIAAMAFSPCSSFLATAVGMEVRLWKVSTGEPAGSLTTEGNEFFNRVISLAYSPCGSLLATGTDNFRVFLWEVPSGRPRSKIRTREASIGCVAFSRDGKSLALSTVDSNLLWTYDTETGELIGTFEGHRNAIKALDWSLDGAILVTGGRDGLVMRWDARTRCPLGTFIPDCLYPRPHAP